MTVCAMTILAAEAAGQGVLMTYLPKFVNLLIFGAILYFVLRKPLLAFFETRRSAILEELDRARRAKEEAQARVAEIEARMADLEREQEEMRLAAVAEADAEAARVAARTDDEIRKISEAADREIDGALKAARADLQRFVAEKSVELAEATIRAEMTDADRKLLLERYSEQLVEVKK